MRNNYKSVMFGKLKIFANKNTPAPDLKVECVVLNALGNDAALPTELSAPSAIHCHRPAAAGRST
jgi:hypothetical protein